MDSGFDKIQGNNCTLFINKDFRNDNLEQTLLGGEETLQERCQLAAVFSSDTSRVHKFTARFDGVERGVYFKQYLFRSAWDFIKHLVRASRAKRAFKASLMLRKNGFDAPAVIAMGEYQASFFDRKNFLATLEVENAKQIHEYIPGSQEGLTREQLRNKRELIRAFGRTVGKMHGVGIFHGDLKLVNVLARQENNGWHFFFIDNERTRKFWRLPGWLRLKNLVQLNMFRGGISRTDRMRFFKCYLQENRLIARKRTDWAKKITTKTNCRLGKRDKYFDYK